MKITRTQAKQVETVERTMSKAYTKVCSAIDKYNDEVGALYAALETELREYTEAVESAQAIVEEVATELRDKIEARSDAWRESDAGNAAESWVSEWEEFTIAEAEADEPTEVEHPEDPHDAFGGLTHEME